MKKRTLKIVAYHIDEVEYSSCYYDTPGPVFFYYRPKNKSTIFPESSGIWVKVHSKYRDSKKIGKEQGFCMGGDYGVMKMPRYTKSIMLIGEQYYRARNSIYSIIRDKVYNHIKDMASMLVKELNKSGYLLISCGDIRFDIEKKVVKIQFNLGMCLTVMPTNNVAAEYSQDAFVWRSIST